MNRVVFWTVLGLAASLWLGHTMATGPVLVAVKEPAEPPPVLKSILNANPPLPQTGNPTGAATIVEFFDYRCPYCQAMQPRLQEVLAGDKRVRLIFADWPVFGGISVYAAKVAIASNWQGKYLAVHDALFAQGKTMTEASVRDAAKNAGVDLKQLDDDLAARSNELDQILMRTDEQARALGFEGTPGFIIGNAVVPGAVSSDDIKSLLR